MNKDDKRRCAILGLEYPPKYHGGIADFESATAQQLERLLDEGFADPEDSQNNSPTYQEFISFLKEHTGFKAEGYLVTPDRPDCRVSITGVVGPRGISQQELKAFVMFARDADEFRLTPPYAWWD